VRHHDGLLAVSWHSIVLGGDQGETIVLLFESGKPMRLQNLDGDLVAFFAHGEAGDGEIRCACVSGLDMYD
jgi:hypothetical protein